MLKGENLDDILSQKIHNLIESSGLKGALDKIFSEYLEALNEKGIEYIEEGKEVLSNLVKAINKVLMNVDSDLSIKVKSYSFSPSGIGSIDSRMILNCLQLDPARYNFGTYVLNRIDLNLKIGGCTIKIIRKRAQGDVGMYPTAYNFRYDFIKLILYAGNTRVLEFSEENCSGELIYHKTKTSKGRSSNRTIPLERSFGPIKKFRFYGVPGEYSTRKVAEIFFQTIKKFGKNVDRIIELFKNGLYTQEINKEQQKSEMKSVY